MTPVLIQSYTTPLTTYLPIRYLLFTPLLFSTAQTTLAMSVMWGLTGNMDPRLVSDGKALDVAFDAGQGKPKRTAEVTLTGVCVCVCVCEFMDVYICAYESVFECVVKECS